MSEMQQHADVTGLLVAGGLSQRFGADKARFVVQGRPMIARVYEAVAAVSGTVLVSVAEGTAPFALPGTARYVVDRHAGAGPLAGLHAGLLAAETPWVLAVACDMPALTADALHTLLAVRDEALEAVVAVTPGGQRQPLCACFHRRVLPAVEAQLAAGRRALQALLDRLSVGEVVLPEAVLQNVNTPDDLRQPER